MDLQKLVSIELVSLMILLKPDVTSSGVIMMRKQEKNENGQIKNIPAATAYPKPVVPFITNSYAVMLVLPTLIEQYEKKNL